MTSHRWMLICRNRTIDVMTIRVELDQLLSLALGNLEVGAVNFNILHGVLREILNHLGIEKKGKDIGDDGGLKAAFALLKNKQEAGNEGLKRSKMSPEKATMDKISFSSAVFSAPFHAVHAHYYNCAVISQSQFLSTFKCTCIWLL